MNNYLFDDEPRCGNCVYRDGCKGAMYEDGYCDEWEGEDEEEPYPQDEEYYSYRSKWR